MILTLSHWTTQTIENNELSLFNWKTNNSVDIFDLNHPIYQFTNQKQITIDYPSLSSEYQEDIDWLLAENFLISDKDKIEIKDISVTPIHAEDTLQLILLPAGEACNLDCVYCYEDHTDRSSMNEPHIHTLLNLIKNSGKKQLSIEYFGGEPMMNMKFIRQFGEALKSNNINFQASITTNATLLNEKTLAQLYDAGVKSFQITLDGYRELHNKLRPSKNNSIDSFEKVSGALRTLAESHYSDLNITLRMNVNSESINEQNFKLFTETLESIVPKNDARFFILPKIIGDYSSANLMENERAKESYCSDKKQANEVTEKFEMWIDKYYRSATAALLTHQGGYSCYAGNPNSLVITPDLKIRKCTVALNDPINFVGYLTADGQLHKTINYDLWEKNYADNYCISCFLNKACQGNSCPLANIKKNAKNCIPFKFQPELLTKKVVRYYRRLNNE
ncbi:radical SAM protein [Histophilus somni]|uniref:radical SAM protein n=1 Tax=Histophilus somni TaxID=731 RepID=UPI00201F9F91|nr:radical SAM protein [Histophilus somni]